MPSSKIQPSAISVSNAALAFMVICLVVYILHAAAAIMIPFVIALFVWYLINAIARRLELISWGKRHLPHFLCFLLAILALVGGLWFVYKLISANAGDVIRAAPVYQKKFVDFIPKVLSIIPEDVRPAPADIAGYVNVGAFMTMLVKTFTGIAGKTLVVLFYTGFLLYEQRYFSRKLHEMTGGARTEARLHHLLQNIDGKIRRYIGVKTFLSILTGVFTWMILLSFKVDFAEFWGVMAFILNFIPYAGSIIAVVLPSMTALVQYGDPGTFAAVMAALAFLHIVCGHVLDPRMLGDSLNLSPIMIIFSLAGWGMIWGVPGMFLAVPILAMAAVTLAQFAKTRPIAVLLSKTGDLEGKEE